MNLRKLFISLGLILAMWLIVAIRLGHGQVIQSIGEIMWNSPDLRLLRNGCILSFDFSRRKFYCNQAIRVKLNNGYYTVVSNPLVTKDSEINCDCRGNNCSDGAMVLGYHRIESVRQGSFTIKHAYALGNEFLTCRIN